MRLSRQVQASLFFLQKDFEHKKQQSAKLTIFTFLEVFVPEKLLPLLFSFFSLIFVLLVGFGLIYVFVRSKSSFFFWKQKRIRLDWNCFDSLIYYSTDVYPYQPACQEFTCSYLYLFVIIWENLSFLWESFWSVIF